MTGKNRHLLRFASGGGGNASAPLAENQIVMLANRFFFIGSGHG
jgi:hypothetical protein